MKVENIFPRSRRLTRWGIALAACLLCAVVAFPQTDDKTPPASPSAQDQPSSADKPSKSEGHPTGSGMTKLKIRVTTPDGKPVSNASVYVRFNTPGGLFHHDKQAELNFKTNLDGSVKVPEVPQGDILVQVIAKGWHTYGKWYNVETEEEAITVKLEPPPRWY